MRKILDIQPTPSPLSMKIIFSGGLYEEQRKTFTKQSKSKDELIQNLLTIDGVQSIYYASDFLAIDKNAKADWREVLLQIRQAFGESVDLTAQADEEQYTARAGRVGEGSVFVQFYANIPLQVKVTDGLHDIRRSLGDRFSKYVYAL
ncbi:MAG: NifU N-terminal domain-containing protein, partial [Bacilli bacterium]